MSLDARERSRLLADASVTYRIRFEIEYHVKPLRSSARAVEERMIADIKKAVTLAAKKHPDGHVSYLNVEPAQCVLSPADAVVLLVNNSLGDEELALLLQDATIVEPYVTEAGNTAVPARLIELAAINEAAKRERAAAAARGHRTPVGRLRLVNSDRPSTDATNF